MSFNPTSFRPLARAGWGGRASSQWRAVSKDPMRFRGQIGTVVYRGIGGLANFALIGVSRDSTGAVLGSCVIDLFYTASDVLHMTTTSDASGNFRFDTMPPGPFYIVAYKPGSPDVAGTTVGTLQPTAV